MSLNNVINHFFHYIWGLSHGSRALTHTEGFFLYSYGFISSFHPYVRCVVWIQFYLFPNDQHLLHGLLNAYQPLLKLPSLAQWFDMPPLSYTNVYMHSGLFLDFLFYSIVLFVYALGLRFNYRCFTVYFNVL